VTPLERIDQVRADLAEARRYARLRASAAYALECLHRALAGVMEADLPCNAGFAARLQGNLLAAAAALDEAPAVTQGYIDGARHELAGLRRALEAMGGGP
jgi:hypothetical protein